MSITQFVMLENSFIYLRGRFYDPKTSRMISEDPARSGLNWYTYVNNNPIMFIDPTGLVGQMILDYYYGQGYYGVLENKDDYAIFYKTDKNGSKKFTYWTNGNSVTFPNTVTGTMNGSTVSFNPNVDWGGPGGGDYIGKPMKNADGRYNVAVGPKVLDANYPDSGKLWTEDFNNMNILVVLEHVKIGEIKIIECYVDDFKAHSYNKYPDGQKVGNLGTASINVENGLVQTGLAYPNSYNAGLSKALSPDDFGGIGVVEFKTDKIDVTISDYRLIKVINFN